MFSIAEYRSVYQIRPTVTLLFCAVWMILNQPTSALITGGVGNMPLSNPGWPEGAKAIFNNQARIAWWEGPPFGGGQYHAEYRADAKTLNAILVDFAKLNVKTKRIIVHDGSGHSFWLNPNGKKEKQAEAKMDFRFMVWSQDNWKRLRNLPAEFNPVAAADLSKGPPAEIEIYTGGNIRWEDVTLPKGVEVTDNRLVAHGFKTADGIVIEGKVIDLVTNGPISASLQLERIERREKGGYDYAVVAETVSDKRGHYVFKNAPAGWHRIVAKANGYLARVIGQIRSEGQPRWHWFESGLSQPATVSGHVRDEEGNPLPDVTVRLSSVIAKVGGRYESPQEHTVKTDVKGTFRFDNVPVGTTSIRVSKVGYCRPGLSKNISTPKEDVAIQMMKSAFVRISVEFDGKDHPKSYIVHLEPEGGSAVGKWSGSGYIDANNERLFKNVPPGKYVVYGHPNPTSAKQKTEKVPIDLKGGKVKRLVLNAK